MYAYLNRCFVAGFTFGTANYSTSPSGNKVIPINVHAKQVHSLSMCTQNKCKQVHVLAEFDVSFIYEDSFDISQENEQMKLQRFLYFEQ